MKKYRIMFITPRLDIGGEELSTIAIVEELKKRGHSAYYMSSGGPLLQELENKNIRYVYGSVGGRSIADIMRGMLSVRKGLMEHDVDIIHASEPRLAIMGYLARKTVVKKDIKVIWHDRGTLNHYLSAMLFNFMGDFVITNSNYEKKELVKRGLVQKKVRAVHNSMYLPIKPEIELSPVFNDFNIKMNESSVIGITSRLILRKGHQYLFNAVPEILKHFPTAKFLVVGDGILRNELEALVRRLGINDNVYFVGYRLDLEKIYPFLDILVGPSLYEPLGNVSMEAMAVGKPVVASKTGGIPEVVEDGVTGILVPIKNPKKIAEAVIYLLNNPDIAKKMGEAGRKRVQECFTIDRVGNELEEVYAHVMGEE